MATKNSIQEDRIQENVSAPRAAQMIPRRDLLTGAALVLVGSAGGCTAQTSGAASSKPKSPSDFVHDFIRDFIGKPEDIKPQGQPDMWPDPNRKWPNPNTPQCPDGIATDYQTFVSVLMTAGYVGAAAPPSPTPLEAQIWQYLQPDPTAPTSSWKKYGWPAGTPEPTPTASSPYYDIHLVEICVIQDRLLQAINSYKVCAAAASAAAASGAAASGAAASGAAPSAAVAKLPHPAGGQWPPH